MKTCWIVVALVFGSAGCSEYDLGSGRQPPGAPPCNTEDCLPPPACVEVEPPVLHFPTFHLDVDPPAELTFVVRNVCEGLLAVDPLGLEEAETPFSLSALDPAEIGFEGESTVTVSFAPVVTGEWVTRVIVPSNDPDQPIAYVAVAGDSSCYPGAPDTDGDTVPDPCDICEGGDDRLDDDYDGVPDFCDLCPDFDDHGDEDGDGLPDECDPCPWGDDSLDADSDGIADACDDCPEGPDDVDSDGDGVADACDQCEGHDDRLDSDGDGVIDGCDACPGYDDHLDADSDGIADGCDPCPEGDNYADGDADGVPDGCDLCPGDDYADADGDGTPDGCDRCPGYDDRIDSDYDTVPDGCDVCPSGDDALDSDGDLVADACDLCPGGDDAADADLDGVADACDLCPGHDDRIDTDNDTVPDGCDVCPGFDDLVDTDGDGFADGCDVCPEGDDLLDTDGDGTADACDLCPDFDDRIDSDGDTVPDLCDLCSGGDDRIDHDADGVPDFCDLCPGFDDLVDSDGDGVADGCDLCPGYPDHVDSDGDGAIDGCDLCPGYDDNLDFDLDGVPDDCDDCPGFPGEDIFVSEGTPLSDLLFVVDNSCSMEDDQIALANNFGTFIDEMVQLDADWRIGIITTDRSRFVGPFIEWDDPDPQGDFEDQVIVGSGGNGTERGIDMAWTATQPGGDAAPGSEFFREFALLAVIFVSDEPDQSGRTAQDLVSYLLSIKANDRDFLKVHSITAENGYGYEQAAELTDGLQLSLLDDDWGDDLAALAEGSVATTVFPLSQVPVPLTIEVYDDGALVEFGWVYDQERNAVLFTADNRPDEGSIVRITYVVDCGGSLNACGDNVDNDGDGIDDFPNDPGCVSPFDSNEEDPVEAPECSDTTDNDGDRDIDYPDDGECESAAHQLESCAVFGRDRFGYRVCTDEANTMPCPDLRTAGFPLGAGDDTMHRVGLGFPFDFYGRLWNEVHISANGTLQFTDTAPWQVASNLCLPAANRDSALFVWWDDLNPAAGGDIYVRTSGAAPQRTFEVQWIAPHFDGGSPIDVRAVLYEKTGDMAVCYVDTETGDGNDHGASATSGLQATIASFVPVSCFDTSLRAGSVIRYLHP